MTKQRALLAVLCLVLPLSLASPSPAQPDILLEAEATLVPPPPTPVVAPGAVPGSVDFGTTFSAISQVCFIFHFTQDLLDPGERLTIQPYGFGFQNVFSQPQQDRTICVVDPGHHAIITQFLDGIEAFAIRMEIGSVIIGALKISIRGTPSSPVGFTISATGSHSVMPGGTASGLVTVTSAGDLVVDPPVALTATNVVPNSAVTLNPPAGTPTFSSTMNVVTSPLTAPGFYWVVVTAKGGGITRSLNYFVQVQEPTAFPPANLVLEPKMATNTAGTEHCVTATVTDANGNPVPGVTVRFSASGANNASGQATTDANGKAEFCYTGATAGDDTITAYADTNNNNVQDSGEPGDTATKTWVAGPPATLTLDPKTAMNPVDSPHCVKATVKDAFGNPVQGVKVRFSVTGSVTTGGSATTDNNGEATFCYDGPALPGMDAIHAFADTDGDGSQDAPPPVGDEPFDDATKTWVLPVTTPGCEIKITNGGWIVASNGDRASFGGNAKADENGNVTGTEEYQDHGPAQPFNLHGNVLVVVCNSATSATIFGEATIDGSGSHTYRIDVQDLGEPGKGFDHYRMRVNAYDSGDQILKGGNVQIHKS